MWEKKRTGLSECPTIMTVVSDLCIHTCSSQYQTMRMHAAAESSWLACSSPLTIGRSSSHRHSLHGCLPGFLHNHIIGGERAKGWLWRAPQTPWSGVLQCVAVCWVCCSVLQCVAVCCSVRAKDGIGRTPQTSWQVFVFKQVAHINTLQHTATHYSTLQHTATFCNALQHTVILCNKLQQEWLGRSQQTPWSGSTLYILSRRAHEHTATHCNTFQHTVTHCSTMQHPTTRVCPKSSTSALTW